MEYLPSSLMILRKWFFLVIHKSNIFKALFLRIKSCNTNENTMCGLNASGYMNTEVFFFYVCVCLYYCSSIVISKNEFWGGPSKRCFRLNGSAFLKVFRGSNWFNYFHLDKRNKHFWESTMLVLNPIWILDSWESSLKCRFPEHLKSSSVSLWFWYIQ